MAMILRTDLTILLLRKESGSTVEFVRAVKKNLQSDIAQSFSMAVNKKPIQLLKDTQTEIHTNLFTDQGSKESQLVADGVRSFAITGKHFKRIYTDDINSLKDRISNAERIQTDNIYQELTEHSYQGRGDTQHRYTWHKQDTFRLMPLPELFTIYDTGLFDEEGILKKKQSMTASLFSANYEVETCWPTRLLFPNPK